MLIGCKYNRKNHSHLVFHMNALIGYTGFVGSSLAKQFQFSSFYNSQNIQYIMDRRYELVVCAGAPGVKWWANKHRDEDRCNLHKLFFCLNRCYIEKLVLISTVDVFQQCKGQDESLRPDSYDGYGENRLWLEKVLSDEFDTSIVRLPALFGYGLKKNYLYDLIHGQRLDSIHRNSRLQWYNIQDLWNDISVVIKEKLGVVHLVNEPVTMGNIIDSSFPDVCVTGTNVVNYDVRTMYSNVLGGTGFYIKGGDKILNEISEYVERVRLAI